MYLTKVEYFSLLFKAEKNNKKFMHDIKKYNGVVL